MKSNKTSEKQQQAVPDTVTQESASVKTEQKPSEKPLVKLAKELYDYFEMFVFASLFVLLVFSFAIRMCTVRGASMEQTLFEGEQLLISNIGYQPEQGDILIFHQTSEVYEQFNEPIVKRVIATEGQWVDVDRVAETVTIYDENFENPQILDESAYRYLDTGRWDRALAMEFPVQVPEGHIFVMGDNRNNSSDSSTAVEIGFVDTRRILGRVICRVAPIQKLGTVE